MMPIDPAPPRPVDGHRINFAQNQPQYEPLPAYRMNDDGKCAVSRWKLTDEERSAIAAGADLWLSVMTFGHPLQPVLLGVKGSDVHSDWPDE